MDEPIIDIGAGASMLVDRLLDAGYRDVSVLDVASDALDAARLRLGQRKSKVMWIAADLLTWRPARKYRVWHDRAVFHFLVDADDRDRYRFVARRAVDGGGHLIIGTFAADGPTHCSGLPTAGYSADELAAQFPGCQVVRAMHEEHQTPTGNMQPFTWLLLAAERN